MIHFVIGFLAGCLACGIAVGFLMGCSSREVPRGPKWEVYK